MINYTSDMRFRDRQQAGIELAKALEEYRDTPVVVYALPRGGVVLGKAVAASLHAPLDLLIPRKVGIPGNEEYAIASVTETGEVVKSEAEVAVADPYWFERAVAIQRGEAKRRRERYLAGRGAVDAEGKTAIIVDDGIATGLTMKAAIADVKTRKPTFIVVAVPVAPREIIRDLERLVDRVLVLEKPRLFLGSIGAYYDSFEQVSDEEVVDLFAPTV